MKTLTRNTRDHRLNRGHIAFEEKHLYSQTRPVFPDTPPLTSPCMDFSETLHSQGSICSLSFSVSHFFSSSSSSLPRTRRRELFPTTSSPPVPSVILPHSPLLSPIFLLRLFLCPSSGQTSWQQRSVTLTLKSPAEWSFLRTHSLTPCHVFLSS